MKLRINRRTSFTQGEMKTLLGKIAHTCKIIIAFYAAQLEKWKYRWILGRFRTS